MDNNIAFISNKLNHCLSLLFTVNKLDLTKLACIHEELQQIKNSDFSKGDIKKWAERTSVLTESIILGETGFKNGISRLTTTISDVLESLNEALTSGDNYNIENKVYEEGNSERKNELSKEELRVCEFLNESFDLIHNGEVALLDLETNSDNIEAINTVFRTCHTIKGSAGFLRLTHIQKLAHAMEDLLSKARDKIIPLTTQSIGLLLHSMDILKELIYGVKKSNEGEECFIPRMF